MIARAAWDTSRARALDVARDWRRCDAFAMLADRFDAVAERDAGIATRRAIGLLGDAHWIDGLLAPLVAALAADPLFEPPLTVAREDGRAGAVLLDTPAARITASVVTPAGAGPTAAPPTVVAPGQIVVTRYVRAGGARLLRWHAGPIASPFAHRAAAAARPCHPLTLADGDVIVHDGRVDGQIVADARRPVVALAVMLRAGAAALTREYATDDGRLLRVASTDDAASRGAMLRTLLRVGGRTDAPDVFAAAARDPASHVRWGAMREWLALDARAALPTLTAMADDDADPDIRAAAAQTLVMVQGRIATCPA